MGKAWEHWYHVTEHVYGSWLRGDARGWRARHHREHVIGDYKNPPPPGMYTKLYEYSKSLMKRDPVWVANELRQFVVDAVVEKLVEKGIEVRVASMDGCHLHALARFLDDNPRWWMGLAKKHASHLCRQLEVPAYPKGGLWAKRGHEKPIVGPDHYLSVENYISEHFERGAALSDGDA
jgi:hypothetical protein